MRTPHTTAMLIPLAAALVLAAAGSAAAQKNKCTDWPLEVSITSGPSGVLFGDSKGTTYRNGVDGVSTVVNICSGSYDATVGLLAARRYMGFDFSSFIEDSTASWPTWMADQFLTKPFLNVRNMLWGRKYLTAASDGTFTFQTRMTIGYVKGAGDRSDYVLRFFPTVVSPGPEVTPAAPPFDDATVPVTVVDDPATCTWTVTVLPDYTGGLYKTSTNAFAGHYHMYFQLTLRALAGCTLQ